MEAVGVLIALAFVIWLVTEPTRRRQRKADERAWQYQQLTAQMSKLCRVRLTKETHGEWQWTARDADFETMTYDVSGQFETIASTTTHHLFRHENGVWYAKPWHVRHDGDHDGPAEETALEEFMRENQDDEDDECARAEYAHLKAEAAEWSRLPEPIAVCIEEAYQRCVRFFLAHPGLTPDTTKSQYVAGDLDPVQWGPPQHATWNTVRASTKKLRNAEERLKRAREAVSSPG